MNFSRDRVRSCTWEGRIPCKGTGSGAVHLEKMRGSTRASSAPWQQKMPALSCPALTGRDYSSLFSSFDTLPSILHPLLDSPTQKVIVKMEQVWQRSTKMTTGPKTQPCEGRLGSMGSFSLQKRWLRGDVQPPASVL